MRKGKNRIMSALFSMVLVVVLCLGNCLADSPSDKPAANETRGSRRSYSVELATAVSTSCKGIRNDSWSKRVTVIGYKNSDYEQYCDVTVGFDDGVFSNTDYMYTGIGSSYKCNTATGIYICGMIKNSSGKSSWSTYVTNGGKSKKISIKHSGKAYYYICFSD